MQTLSQCSCSVCCSRASIQNEQYIRRCRSSSCDYAVTIAICTAALLKTCCIDVPSFINCNIEKPGLWATLSQRSSPQSLTRGGVFYYQRIATQSSACCGNIWAIGIGSGCLLGSNSIQAAILIDGMPWKQDASVPAVQLLAHSASPDELYLTISALWLAHEPATLTALPKLYIPGPFCPPAA